MNLDSVAKSLDDKFQSIVSVVHAILCPISKLSQALQSPHLNLVDAHRQLNLFTSQMDKFCLEDEYKKLLANTKTLSSFPALSGVVSTDDIESSSRAKTYFTSKTLKLLRDNSY